MEIKGHIYKITSPDNCVYIGQSKNVEYRIAEHKSRKNSKQPKLNNSLKKYGAENHIFNIIEECDIEDLNCRERYWQEFYDVMGVKGLNSSYIGCGDMPVVHSRETLVKMSERQKGENNSFYKKRHSEEAKEKIKIANSGENNHNFGKHLSEEHKQRLREFRTGRPHSKATLEKLSALSTGSNNGNADKVFCIETNKEWGCKKDCALELGLSYASLCNKLAGRTPNDTTLRNA